jgi:probable rRNA maturation factor
MVEIDIVVRATGAEIPPTQLVKMAMDTVWKLFSGPENARLCVVFMNQAEHCALHNEFLNDPSATDVMAFPYQDEDLFGEILVNVEMAAACAAEHQQTIAEEVLLYIVHGGLHLIGFDDTCESTRKEMRDAEKQVMRALSN